MKKGLSNRSRQLFLKIQKSLLQTGIFISDRVFHIQHDLTRSPNLARQATLLSQKALRNCTHFYMTDEIVLPNKRERYEPSEQLKTCTQIRAE